MPNITPASARSASANHAFGDKLPGSLKQWPDEPVGEPGRNGARRRLCRLAAAVIVKPLPVFLPRWPALETLDQTPARLAVGCDPAAPCRRPLRRPGRPCRPIDRPHRHAEGQHGFVHRFRRIASSTARSASKHVGTKHGVDEKAGRAFTGKGNRSICLTKAAARFAISGSPPSAETTSTNGIFATGLKKRIPTSRAGFCNTVS